MIIPSIEYKYSWKLRYIFVWVRLIIMLNINKHKLCFLIISKISKEYGNMMRII